MLARRFRWLWLSIGLAIFAALVPSGGSAQTPEVPGSPLAGDVPALPQPQGLGNDGAGLAGEEEQPSGEATGDPQAVEDTEPDDSAAETDEPIAPDQAATMASEEPVSAAPSPDLKATAEGAGAARAGNAGNLTYEVDIDVPAFRGLEPAISLSYNSLRKTKTGGLYQGWLGYGWGIDGFDVIERASPKNGVPAFDANDVYLLNGEELIDCTVVTASPLPPSCSSGETYESGEYFVTERESFLRIQKDSQNQFVVTDRSGTKSTFRTAADFYGIATPSPEIEDVWRDSRWLLSSVEDTLSNGLQN
ncbi:SpvB/TcaC N-terminal domain-containing protein [Kumtagia ephedrae]|uniref:SpvB/TcaC N-terminal domain-containing protein n=1 Tax=Kumtagia ephedrae TaxID=2116701 RepID=UPI000EA9EDD6|nr:SpvB/TcaC N-terminal domain-containing protein [Mesorhizobium ephedrae]